MAETKLTPPNLRMTRTYYLTWQGCSLVFATFIGIALYYVLCLVEQPDVADGMIIGIIMASVWHETKWKDGD